VLQTLAKHGFVESQNGPKGGYLLARNAREITIAQVLEAIEGPLGITDCHQEQEDKTTSCSCFSHCNIRTPLLKVQDSIYQLLNNMTVADMMGGTPLITVQSLSTAGTGEGVSQ
jgi:Rrf2 family protein